MFGVFGVQCSDVFGGVQCSADPKYCKIIVFGVFGVQLNTIKNT